MRWTMRVLRKMATTTGTRSPLTTTTATRTGRRGEGTKMAPCTNRLHGHRAFRAFTEASPAVLPQWSHLITVTAFSL